MDSKVFPKRAIGKCVSIYYNEKHLKSVIKVGAGIEILSLIVVIFGIAMLAFT